jgi:Sulfotransferase domain
VAQGCEARGDRVIEMLANNNESLFEVDRHLPTVLFVGPMKCGTSWIYEYLMSRPEICTNSGTKETFFFDQRFDSKSLAWYQSHFSHADLGKHHRHIIEVAPTYFESPEVPGRILKTLGQIPIVVTLREPAARAFSLFQHMRRYGMTACTEFRDAVNKHPSILAGSRYAECLRRWHQALGSDRVKVMWMEDLHRDPGAFADACDRSLGLTPRNSDLALPDRVNEATEPRSLPIAAAGRFVGDAIRSIRAYWIIDAAKSLGLKQVFFGKPQSVRQSLADEDRQWFRDLISDDWNELSTLTQLPPELVGQPKKVGVSG